MAAARKDELGAFLEEKGKVHGEYGEQAGVTQKFKDIAHESKNWRKLDSTQRDAIEMICVKLGRILTGNPDEPDHWLDIQGYARLTWERLPAPTSGVLLTDPAPEVNVNVSSDVIAGSAAVGFAHKRNATTEEIKSYYDRRKANGAVDESGAA